MQNSWCNFTNKSWRSKRRRNRSTATRNYLENVLWMS